MDLQSVYSVFDSKAQAYIQPFFSQNDQTAVRSFQAAAMSADHDFHNFSEDYTLYFMGQFDLQSGMYTQDQPPRPIVRAAILAAGGTPPHSLDCTTEGASE